MFAKNLKYLRKNRRMTQTELANKLSKHVKNISSISEWENGKHEPNIGVLTDIADLFGITIDMLMKEDIEKSFYINEDATYVPREISDVSEIINFPDSFTIRIADVARQYLRHMGVVAFSGRDYTTRSDEEVVKMANFIRQQELNMQQSFNSLFGDDD